MVGWLVLAAFAYIALHHIADVSTTTGTPAERMGKALWVAVGGVGQYLVPAIFILGAFAAAALRLKRQRHDDSGDSARFASSNEEPKEGEPEENINEAWRKLPQLIDILQVDFSGR